MWFKLACLAFCLFSFMANAVVILQYHHVSDTTPPSTSIKIDQFKFHMAYLADNQFNVMPLSVVIKQLKAGKKLAPKTVAITFDDGYVNVLTNADPILKQHGFPYTLFVAPDEISAGHSNMLSWVQLSELAQSGVEIANHSSAHLHLNRQLSNESIEQWRQRTRQDIQQAEQQITKYTGQHHRLLAYPYGEYNSDLQTVVNELGFTALGQHSGAINSGSDFSALPRFPASGRYANITTLKVKLNSLAMPVTALVNANPQLDQHPKNQTPFRPTLKVSLNTDDLIAQSLTCYIMGQRVQPQWLDKNSFSIKSASDLPVGRSRYNCTAPSKSQSGYYWFSQPWIRRNIDGSWYPN